MLGSPSAIRGGRAAADGYSIVNQRYYQNPTAARADAEFAALVIHSSCRKLSVQLADIGMSGVTVLRSTTYYNGENANGPIPEWLHAPMSDNPLVINLNSDDELFDAFCV